VTKTQDIDKRDIGRPKADVQAPRLHRINGGLEVAALNIAVEDVPLGALRADVMLACLDSRRARLVVNQAAWRLGVPWINAGVDGSDLLVRIQTFLPALDRLENAPETVARSLDWAIKLALYQDRARRRGVDWNALPAWSHVVATLEGARRVTTPSARRLSTALVLSADGPLREKVHELGPHVREHRLQWNDLDTFLQLRQELFEIDTRFGQIGAGSLFRRLEASGALEYGMPGVDAIDYAIEHPPAEGRARVRGEVIRCVAPGGNKLTCTWSSVVDAGKGTRLDLSDPFTEQEVWNVPQSAPAAPDSATTSARHTSGSDDDFSLWGDLVELCSRSRRRPRE
jgi:hypothetical protein